MYDSALVFSIYYTEIVKCTIVYYNLYYTVAMTYVVLDFNRRE